MRVTGSTPRPGRLPPTAYGGWLSTTWDHRGAVTTAWRLSPIPPRIQLPRKPRRILKPPSRTFYDDYQNYPQMRFNVPELARESGFSATLLACLRTTKLAADAAGRGTPHVHFRVFTQPCDAPVVKPDDGHRADACPAGAARRRVGL